ncbi:MAG: DUF202 domain-containing protein [Armatimonadota bacterium]
MSDGSDGSSEGAPRDEATRPDGIAAITDERTLLARQRTDASANRTVLANERTFTAWLRTGLAAIALGLAVPRLLTTPASEYVGMLLGLLLIVLGVVMGVLAACRYCKVAKDLKLAGLELTPAWVAAVLVAGMSLVGVLAVALLLMA